MVKNRVRGMGWCQVGAEVAVYRPWSGKAFLLMCFEQRPGGRERGRRARVRMHLCEEAHAQSVPASVRKALCLEQAW